MYVLPVSKIACVLIPLIFTANIFPVPENWTGASSFCLCSQYLGTILCLISNVETHLQCLRQMVTDFKTFYTIISEIDEMETWLDIYISSQGIFVDVVEIVHVVLEGCYAPGKSVLLVCSSGLLGHSSGQVDPSQWVQSVWNVQTGRQT